MVETNAVETNSVEISVQSVEAVTKSKLIVVSNRLPFVLKRDLVTNKLRREAR